MNGEAPSRGRPPAGQAEAITARVVEAAWSVLCDTGPEAFSLDRVAIAAHASKQTIYARFSGKLELLQAVLAAKIGAFRLELEDIDPSRGAEAALAELARRAVRSLTAPESLMLDRLVDWIDSAQTGHRDWPTRKAIYAEMRQVVAGHLSSAAGEAAIGDLDAAATFWLDGLIGHIRGQPVEQEADDDWPETFARYFLRAVRP